ncbi:MAG: transketolase [Patescibacteria group bacterium]|nr:transketolase [Patescibacteria group bacterium]
MDLAIRQMEETANLIRQDVIKMIAQAGSGHPAGSLGMADVLTALYFGDEANLDPQKKHNPKRDRVVLSNAHICPVLYSALARRGYFPIKELMTLRRLGSRLQGHSNNHFDIGIETSGGPLSQGISQAVGMAIAGRMDKSPFHVWCLMSDGEFDEGQTWEAFMLAGKLKLGGLTALIDRNRIQISGNTEDVMPLEIFKKKLKAFNWKVIEINGHKMPLIIKAMRRAKNQSKPTAIICHTIPGKGVSFMENKYEWHGKAPNPKEAKQALEELSKL